MAIKSNNNKIDEYEKELKNLESQIDRIKAAYIKGVV